MSATPRRMLAALASGLLAMALAVPALASGAGGHGGGELHINWWSMDPGPHGGPAVGWLMVDFAIFLTLLVVFARKPMCEFLEGRSLKIKNALEEARQAKEAAEARAAELELRLKDLDGEIGDLRQEIQSLGERERVQLEADGKKAAKRMAEDTESQIQSELARARAALMGEAVTLAMELADQKLRERLSASDYQRLNAEFVAGFASTDQEAQP